MMDDLVTWLRAQLDAHERVALEALGAPPLVGEWKWARVSDRATRFARCIDHPAHVLREVETKRRIVDHAEQWAATLHATPEGWTAEAATAYRMALTWILRLLALPYADQPGYREEWRP